MPLVPNWIESPVFLRLNQAPGPSLDMWGGPVFHIVHAALQIDLFEALQPGAASAGTLAARLGCHAGNLAILADALVALGYLRRTRDTYRLTAMTRKWLLDGDGGINFKPFYLYWGALMQQFFPRLDESLRSGESMRLYDWLETQPAVSRNFQQGMIAIARFVAGDVARAMPALGGAQRVLDVGGGHGEYSIALCRAQSATTALLFDGAQALASGRAAVTQAGLGDRISVQEGNFLHDDLPTGFDLALVFNIVHGFTPEENCALFARVKRALNPGGRIAVLDQIHGISPLPLAETVSHVLSVAYAHLLGGRVYTNDDIRGWLEAVGFRDVQRKNLVRASSALIHATAG